jgi:hypothetical protein
MLAPLATVRDPTRADWDSAWVGMEPLLGPYLFFGNRLDNSQSVFHFVSQALPAAGQAEGAVPHLVGSGVEFLDVGVPIGSLPTLKSVTIQFTAQINLNTTAATITNQGSAFSDQGGLAGTMASPILSNQTTITVDFPNVTVALGATWWQTFRYVRLPAAMTYIFAGLKVSVVFAATGAIVGEFVGANAGLGYLLLRGTSYLDMPLIFAVLVALSLIGIFFSYLVQYAERWVMPWQHK